MGKYRQIIIDTDTINVWESESAGEYISISDMADVFADDKQQAIKGWINQKQTIKMLAAWESTANPEFDQDACQEILSQFNNTTISPKTWIEKTRAKGLLIKSGKHAGIYAHTELAFEFGSDINPLFRLHIIRAFSKSIELFAPDNSNWFINWLYANAEYLAPRETISLSDYVIPVMNSLNQSNWISGASDLDMVQVALLGFTENMWNDANPELLESGNTMQDVMRISDFIVIENLKRINERLMNLGVDKQVRFRALLEEASIQKQSLQYLPNVRTKTKSKRKEPLSSFNKNLLKALKFDPNK